MIHPAVAWAVAAPLRVELMQSRWIEWNSCGWGTDRAGPPATGSPGGVAKGVLDECGMSVLYGESGAGKTFFTLDLALHIALGWEWRGHRVRQGGVIYIAAEGQNGIRKRIEAFRQQRGLKDAPPHRSRLIPTGVDLAEPGCRYRSADREGEGSGGAVPDQAGGGRWPGPRHGGPGIARTPPTTWGPWCRGIDRIREETVARTFSSFTAACKDTAKGAR